MYCPNVNVSFMVKDVSVSAKMQKYIMYAKRLYLESSICSCENSRHAGRFIKYYWQFSNLCDEIIEATKSSSTKKRFN